MELKRRDLIDSMALLAHQQWSKWMKYLFSQGRFNGDGTWTMPKWAVDRWLRQMNTKFNHLPENERKSDYEEAEHYICAYEAHQEASDG